MTSTELENLVRTGQLKRESCSQHEFDNLLASGSARLAGLRVVIHNQVEIRCEALEHPVGLLLSYLLLVYLGLKVAVQ